MHSCRFFSFLFFFFSACIKSPLFLCWSNVLKGCERATCAEQTSEQTDLPPLLTYQRKLTHLPEKEGGKNVLFEKKKLCWKRPVRNHVSSFISNVGFLESAHYSRVLKLRVFLLSFGDRCFLVKPADLSVMEGTFKCNNC